ncbi:unannotated protein [freshwater metagenome]|uniref:Unannotated protein n=1 Tax=freshwater metagenome TaxID=449393 RepID=A0A6J6Z7P2_9ZZZZ
MVKLSEPPIRDTNESAISGIATSTNPPRMTPFRLYRPVTTAAPSSENERLSGKALGETPLISITSKPPDKPATPELSANALTFNRSTLIPESWAAIGLSLTALKVLPYLEVNKLTIKKTIINDASALIQKNHLYCEKSSPNLAGDGPTSKMIPSSAPRIGN